MTRSAGVYDNIPEDQYHADRDSLSVSGAKLLLPPSCPAKFRHAMDNPQPAKQIFEFGHFVHLKVLGQGPKVVMVDADSYRTKAAREARDQARADGNIPVLAGNPNDDSAAELEQAEAMTAAVFAHPASAPLFESGASEQSMYTTDPPTGVRLRGRADRITAVDDRLTLVDLKTATTANPAELQRKFWQLGYHMQAAWYRQMVIDLGLSNDPDFLFVVVDKAKPHLVTVLRYTDAAIEEGGRLNRQAIDLYAECHESGVWPGYTDTITTLDLPRWAYPRTTNSNDDLMAALETYLQESA